MIQLDDVDLAILDGDARTQITQPFSATMWLLNIRTENPLVQVPPDVASLYTLVKISDPVRISLCPNEVRRQALVACSPLQFQYLLKYVGEFANYSMVGEVSLLFVMPTLHCSCSTMAFPWTRRARCLRSTRCSSRSIRPRGRTNHAASSPSSLWTRHCPVRRLSSVQVHSNVHVCDRMAAQACLAAAGSVCACRGRLVRSGQPGGPERGPRAPLGQQAGQLPH